MKRQLENQAPFFIHDDETVDDLLKGTLRIIQKKKGYRFSLDALLLAHFARVARGQRVIDLGTGSGIIPMILSAKTRALKIVGLEVQEAMADAALRSVQLNALQDRIEIICGDVRQVQNLFQEGGFDVVTCNPPYRKLESGRINPDIQKAVARHELKGRLDDFIRAAAFLLKPRGRLFVIYKTRRMTGLNCSMRSSGIEPKRMRMVHSKPGLDGEFVLLEGIKNGGEELKVLPPLTIYEDDATYTLDMQAIFTELAAGV